MITTLYIKDNKGTTRVWKIEPIQMGLKISHGILNGAMQSKIEYIDEGLAARSIDQQRESRMNSRINRQMDKGYVEDLAFAINNRPVNSLGLLKPMLAQRFDKVRNVDMVNSFVQPKYNGHRCLVNKKNGVLTAYSRNGKPITSISHILENLFVEEGDTLDGELYCHGVPLQTISSWVKREQPNTKKLVYIVYDIIKDIPFWARLAILERTIVYNGTCKLSYTDKISDMISIKATLKESIANGFEGLIIRQGDFGYEDGKRSRSLIKVKQCFDDEFPVVDILESKDGWARLVLELPNGRTVMCSAPGTIEEKTEVWDNRDDYIGKWVTLEYFELTNDDIPFHPTATMWRNKDEE